MPDSSTEPQSSTIESGSPPLQGERVSFTGTLASMTHRQAQQIVVEKGGVAMPHVSKQVTLLVIGEEGWPLEPDGRASQKLQQVTEWLREGCDIRLLNESEWLHLLGLSENRQEVRRLHTPAMLSQLLDVSVGTIRRWERMGLIKPERKVYRLPYFDFQEVTGARRIIELLEAGVSPSKIEAGLKQLDGLLQGIHRPLVQLDILAHGSRMLYRDSNSLVEPVSGQRCFDFDPPPNFDESPGEHAFLSETSPGELEPHSVKNDIRLHWSVDEWFHEGCRLLDDNQASEAVEAFRTCLMENPGDSETNFFLAEALYRLGNTPGALERYYAAVEADHDYIESWTQIGCVHTEQEEFDSALEAFKIALNVHPDYPEAHLHRAEVLHQLGRTAEAVPHWQTYLKFVDRGPWADNTRQRLAEAANSADA